MLSKLIWTWFYNTMYCKKNVDKLLRTTLRKMFVKSDNIFFLKAEARSSIGANQENYYFFSLRMAHTIFLGQEKLLLARRETSKDRCTIQYKYYNIIYKSVTYYEVWREEKKCIMRLSNIKKKPSRNFVLKSMYYTNLLSIFIKWFNGFF